MKENYFSKDVLDILFLLYKHEVKYLIVGGEAVIYYGHARLTGDIDVFYDRTTENVEKLYKCLLEFWDNDIPGINSKNELLSEGMIFQFGIPPNRLDLLSTIEDVTFAEAWKNRVTESLNYKKKINHIYYIGLNDLIKNKNAGKRNKDLDDLAFLNARKKLLNKN